MKKTEAAESASALIDQRIKELGDWRGTMLAKVREIIHSAVPGDRRGVEVDGNSDLVS